MYLSRYVNCQNAVNFCTDSKLIAIRVNYFKNSLFVNMSYIYQETPTASLIFKVITWYKWRGRQVCHVFELFQSKI